MPAGVRRYPVGFAIAALSVTLMMSLGCTGPQQSALPSPTTPAAASTVVVPNTGDRSSDPLPALLRAVRSAQSLRELPPDLERDLTVGDSAFPRGPARCRRAPNDDDIPRSEFGGCVFGDLHSRKLMVVYGDSHAGMWASALATVALKAKWGLRLFMLPGCPAPDLSFISFQTGTRNTQCDIFHMIAPPAIKRLRPNLVIVTSESIEEVAKGVYATPTQWRTGLITAFKSVAVPDAQLDMIGDIPQWSGDTPNCLAANLRDVQNCALETSKAISVDLSAEAAAARRSGVRYISTTPFVCAEKCEPVINDIRVYDDEYHLTNTYVQYLSGPLAQILDLRPG